MANRIESLSAGMGCMVDVISYYNQEPNNELINKEMREAIYLVYAMTKPQANQQRAVLACICAIFNDNLESTGWLWSVSNECLIDRKYYATDAERRLMASLIAG